MTQFEQMQLRALRAPLASLGLVSELAAIIGQYAVLTELEFLLAQLPFFYLEVPYQSECRTAAHYPRVTLGVTLSGVTLTCREANGDDYPRMRPLATLDQLQQLDYDFMGILCSCRGSLAHIVRRALEEILASQLDQGN
jgi:hypothetical protein